MTFAITRGTSNVFEDLGYPDAAQRQAKLRLAHALNQVLDRRGLTQAATAKVLGLTRRSTQASFTWGGADQRGGGVVFTDSPPW